MESTERTNDCYRKVGSRIRERRKTLRISQERLADLLGISYQQIQKYEGGTSQIFLERLLQIAHVLNVPPAFFYEGLETIEGEKHETDVISRERAQLMQVLLVEDNPGDALLFNKATDSFKDRISIHCISDAETVMDFLRHHDNKYGKPSPDLVILDLSLPKINGLQLLKQIKEDNYTATLPVLILTNSISKKEMREAYRLGAAGFIQKSIDVMEYKESIATVINYWSKVVALPTL